MADASRPEIVELRAQETVAVRGEVAVTDLPAFFERAFHEAAEAANACGATIVGPPFAFYPAKPSATVVVEAGFPVSRPIHAHGEARGFVLPGGPAVRAMHVGPYDTMERTYRDLETWMADRGLEPAAGMWESYLSDPGVEPDPATWRTTIVWPIAGGHA